MTPDPTAPTMTDAELLALSGRLEAIRDEVANSPAMYETASALGALAECDYATLSNAITTLNRLYRWRHWPMRDGEPRADSYLPAPVPVAEPQSLRPDAIRCPDCDGPTMDRGDAFSRVCVTDDCPRVFVNVPQPVKS